MSTRPKTTRWKNKKLEYIGINETWGRVKQRRGRNGEEDRPFLSRAPLVRRKKGGLKNRGMKGSKGNEKRFPKG